MDVSGSTGKSPTSALSFRYTANNEELEQLGEDEASSPQLETSLHTLGENASPKKLDKTSLIEKYFKRSEKHEKGDDAKAEVSKVSNDVRNTSVPKEVSSSPVKDYLNRLGKRNNTTSEGGGEVKDAPNETWKIFSDFKIKITQAVEDIKSRSNEEGREKSVPRDNSISDSEENSANKDCDIDQSVEGDTDNQVSSLNSSIQNLSELTQPLTAKANDGESSFPIDKKDSDSSENTHKNLGKNESSDASGDLLDDSLMDVESGVEALEEIDHNDGSESHNQTESTPETKSQSKHPYIQPIPSNYSTPPRKNAPLEKSHKNPKTHFLNFFMILLTIILLISYVLFTNSSIWLGFILGLWVFCFMGELKCYVLDTYFCEWDSDANTSYQVKSTKLPPTIYTIPSIKEHRPMKKHEGWINHYRSPDYDPFTYHINKTITAFMKLEGSNLRISYTRTKIAKRELWDEKLDKVDFYQHRLYNLCGAQISLLPKGLVRRRQWSKKYPICIVLNESEKIQVIEKENVDKKQSDSQSDKKNASEVDVVDANTSPEKKKKFIWRRKDKSIQQTENEPAKDGLRHRFTKKVQKESKSDSITTLVDTGETHTENLGKDDSSHSESVLESTKSNNMKDELAEEDLDESELSRIKDFIEEAELEQGIDKTADGPEGEWSVHVRRSTDKHARLYLFARTGRDKLDWYRRLITATLECSPSADGSMSEENPASGSEKDDLAVFKLTGDKDTVSFAKPNSKSFETISTEGFSISHPLKPADVECYEKVFWPYIYKVIQAHEGTIKRTTEIGIMCQIDDRRKKKRDENLKNPDDSCACKTLPGELSWVNAMLARVMFDVTRDPHIVKRLQDRIQRKLATLKLPSFMSPLLVTELSLAGCPALAAARASSDSRGVWLHADLRYDGAATLTILTQINLMKLKEKGDLDDMDDDADSDDGQKEANPETTGETLKHKHLRKKKPALFDSDAEDSAESSSDDEAPLHIESADNLILPETTSAPNEGGSSKKKFLRIVDKIATNKYFQQVTDYKYVKRAMEGLSNTDLRLQLELRALSGPLALNLPPPPHDRLWIGFLTNPQLVLKAKPAFGARTLRFTQISNWIEQKLTREFEKVLVMPNMEDIVIDLMTPTPTHFD